MCAFAVPALTPFCACTSQESDDCPAIPENDRCEGAFSVSIFPFTDTGSTEAATAVFPFSYSDDRLDDDFRFLQSEQPRPPSPPPSSFPGVPPFPGECYNVESSTKSVWYVVEGDGSCLSASTLGSNFDTVLAVYKGEGCQGLTCVAQSEYYYSDEVSWKTENGETYYILVGGSYRNAGSFFLQIEVRDESQCPSICILYSKVCRCACLTNICPNAYLQRGTCPANDQCETATTINDFPFIESASTTLATAEGYGGTATSCNVFDGSAKTVWYEFEGEGSCLSASVVGEGFQPALALYEGDDCDFISCSAQPSSGYGPTSSGYGYGGGLLSWRSEIGTAYKLAVAGANSGLISGDYLLVVTVRAHCLNPQRYIALCF
jgi:hypothetical protein